MKDVPSGCGLSAAILHAKKFAIVVAFFFFFVPLWQKTTIAQKYGISKKAL
jgi:hypothetical protein